MWACCAPAGRPLSGRSIANRGQRAHGRVSASPLCPSTGPRAAADPIEASRRTRGSRGAAQYADTHTGPPLPSRHAAIASSFPHPMQEAGVASLNYCLLRPCNAPPRRWRPALAMQIRPGALRPTRAGRGLISCSSHRACSHIPSAFERAEKKDS